MDDLKVSQKYKEFKELKQAKCEELASGYTPEKRRYEIVMIVLFLSFFTFSCLQILSIMKGILTKEFIFTFKSNAIYYSNLVLFGTSFSALIAGMICADFFSGMVHWFADSYFTKDALILGALIRSFREHHVDQQAITRHDVIESNGDNCMLGNLIFVFGRLPIISMWWTISIFSIFSSSSQNAPKSISIISYSLLVFITSFSFWIALTNQIHKWAHQFSVPPFVKFLQDYRIILHRHDHRVHHTNPFDRYYCITTGWLNPVLQFIYFWRILEFIISVFTFNHLVPREDDQKWTSHMQILETMSGVEDDSFIKSSSSLEVEKHSKQE